MHSVKGPLLWAGVVYLGASINVWAADVIYFDDNGGSGPRGLYDFDTETGVSSFRAPVSDGPRFFALTHRPSDGAVFGVHPSNDSILYHVDIDTGDSTIAAATGLVDLANITFDPTTDTLYALGRNSHELFRIDPNDGSSVLIGDASPVQGGLTFYPDGALYGFTVLTGDLYRIDTFDGTATYVGGSGDVGAAPLYEDADFTAAGELFLTDFDGAIFQVDPATGHRTLVGTTGMGDGLLGILGVPEPATVALVGFVGLATWRRRRP